MRWFQRLSERLFRFVESREKVDRFINRIGIAVMLIGIVAAVVLAIAIVSPMIRH